MPVLWSQNPNIRYSPPVVLGEESKSLEYFGIHASELAQTYGSQIYVNLVNKAGSEGRIASAFQRLVEQVPDLNITYTHFDFHRECKNMKFERVYDLLTSMEKSFSEQGFFSVQGDNIKSQQKGVIRTNCIDCLDRTNVVQSIFSRWVTTKQLNMMGVIDTESFEMHSRFEAHFKTVWADNADMISVQYSGTPALKTDFTRTGKRKIGGIFNDLKHSIMRYFLNNFSDGQRQDSYDLLLGNYSIDQEAYKSPFPRPNPARWILVLVLVYVATATITFFPPGWSFTEASVFLASQGFLWFSVYNILALFHPHFVDLPHLGQHSHHS
eukprot:TRINITY_DN5872_c0_g1_i1.p1 TRINITY_DN5872_c0_g1~~TRINITY_DN5872_c0_g1_i1.p1  ORF type:complete len:325 (-),score=54.93 TRINITY_DN5872_c0_g1_i1:122-1096(-)